MAPIPPPLATPLAISCEILFHLRCCTAQIRFAFSCGYLATRNLARTRGNACSILVKTKTSCYSARKKTHVKHCENYLKVEKKVFLTTPVYTAARRHKRRCATWPGAEPRMERRDTGCFLLVQGLQTMVVNYVKWQETVHCKTYTATRFVIFTTLSRGIGCICVHCSTV